MTDKPTRVEAEPLPGGGVALQAAPDFALIERCCRALCEAHGHNPDALAVSGPPMRGPNGSVVMAGRAEPLWHFYVRDVNTVLEAAARKDDP